MRALLSSMLLITLVAPVGAAFPGAEASAPATPPLSRFEGNPRRTPVVDLVQRVRGAVVNIHSERLAMGAMPEELFALAPSQNRINGMGTGIIIDPQGYIITNHHVVEDVNVIRVRLADGSTSNARVLARDAASDLALLKIDVNKPLPVMPMGTASDLMVGETVVAIGNAYGYDHTVTVGVVSATRRDVSLNKEISYKGLIQTDASINPGNSGGPLLNIKGELIGVNVAIRAGAQGIGFAIPVDSMLQVAADMMSIQKRLNLRHGLVCRDQLTTDNQVVRREVVVDQVEKEGPAARAGLQPGDVIVRAGASPVKSRLDLERLMGEAKVGTRVPLEVVRAGKEQRVELTLEDANRGGAGAEVVWRKTGLRVDRAPMELVSRTNSQLHGGLLITEVRPESAAARAGLQKGDVLVGLHQWEMLNQENINFVLSHPDLSSFNPLRFYIIRGGQVHRGWLQVGE